MSKLKQIERIVKSLKPTAVCGVIHSVTFLEARDGACLASIEVKDDHANHMGGMGGGFSATLIDIVTTAALILHPNNRNRPAVSVNMNLSYLKGAKVGDELLISSTALRSGKSFAFLEAEIRNKKTNDLLVKGEHTMFYLE